MSRLELIVIIFAVVLYLWWRAKKRFAAAKARFRDDDKPAKEASAPLTLEKDPVTGTYRVPRQRD